MTEPAPSRYPGYDVLSKRSGVSWNDETRRVVDARLAVPREPRFFDADEWRTLGAVCDRIMPQPPDRPPVPLPSYVDRKMASNSLDGYRHAELPEQRTAWRRGLAALEAEAQARLRTAFHALPPDRQDGLLRQMEQGELDGPAWQGMPGGSFFRNRIIPDILGAYYAHPTAWSEIGFGGPASPRGYVRMGLDRRDPWEAAAGDPGAEARARRENGRVR